MLPSLSEMNENEEVGEIQKTNSNSLIVNRPNKWQAMITRAVEKKKGSPIFPKLITDQRIE